MESDFTIKGDEPLKPCEFHALNSENKKHYLEVSKNSIKAREANSAIFKMFFKAVDWVKDNVFFLVYDRYTIENKLFYGEGKFIWITLKEATFLIPLEHKNKIELIESWELFEKIRKK